MRTAIAGGAVELLGLHLLVDEPECVDVAGDESEESEADVDERVAPAARHKDDSRRREEDRDLRVS